MYYNRYLGVTFFYLWCVAAMAQSYSIRGNVTDDVTSETIIGALVYIQNFEEQSAITNDKGEFKIEGLSIGRHILVAEYFGYHTFLKNIEIKSGKELVINVTMKEEIKMLDDFVVTTKGQKARPVNSMSYASSRTFSVEESNKFAGAVEDPARMVQSFAGVVPTNDGNNYISIRGNHPNGLLYRVEGIDIPNPNHFGDVASSGGGVSVLSSQVLSDSDFSSGAFAAEYSNALGGIFDIRLRRGNNEKHEFTAKAGFLGMEFAAEGPFSKQYRGSFLVNYRYSTLSLIDKLGVALTGVLNYSDLSYNIYLPLKKGNISLFGINGLSNQDIDETLDDIDTTTGALDHRFIGSFISDMSVNGIKYNLLLSKGYINAVVAHSYTKSGFTEDTKTIFRDYTYFNKFNINYKTNKISAALNYTQKLNSRLSYRLGTYFDLLGFDMRYDDYVNSTQFNNLIHSSDNTKMIRVFGQLQYSFNEKWSSNFGFHFSKIALNDKQALEPRGNIQYTFNEKSNISLAYGMHSQVQPLMVYYIKDVEGKLINNDLDFTKAHHVVLTHNLDITNHTRLKTEIYYQRLYKIPVGIDENKNYAIINQQFFFPDFKLINDGRGRNYGVEFTLERFVHNSWYYLFTTSLFDAKYKTPNTDWLNTRYNNQFTSSLSLGKEWMVGKSKRNILGINIKNTYAGGQWDTPIDREASQIAKREIRDESKPFSIRVKDFYKLDIGIKYKRNKKSYTSTLSLDLMNATNNTNIGGITYDIQNDKMKEWTMMPFVPVLSYKIEF